MRIQRESHDKECLTERCLHKGKKLVARRARVESHCHKRTGETGINGQKLSRPEQERRKPR